MERQLPQPWALGDVRDVEAYVRKIVATLGRLEQDEFEESVADGLELVARKYRELRPGQSLQRALSRWLASRLRDPWRQRHPEWRRDARGATAYALPVPTGLAWEHPEQEGEQTAFAARDERELIDSRLALEAFGSESDLRDPRQIGRYRGVPSWAGLATGAARELWPAIREERAATEPPPRRRAPVRFIKHL